MDEHKHEGSEAQVQQGEHPTQERALHNRSRMESFFRSTRGNVVAVLLAIVIGAMAFSALDAAVYRYKDGFYGSVEFSWQLEEILRRGSVLLAAERKPQEQGQSASVEKAMPEQEIPEEQVEPLEERTRAEGSEELYGMMAAESEGQQAVPTLPPISPGDYIDRWTVVDALRYLNGIRNISIYIEDSTNQVAFENDRFEWSEQFEMAQQYGHFQLKMSSQEGIEEREVRFLDLETPELDALARSDKDYRILIFGIEPPEKFLHDDPIREAYREYLTNLIGDVAVTFLLFGAMLFLFVPNGRALYKRYRAQTLFRGEPAMQEEIDFGKTAVRGGFDGSAAFEESRRVLAYAKLEFKLIAFVISYVKLLNALNNLINLREVKYSLIGLMFSALFVAVLSLDLIKSDKEEYFKNSYLEELKNRKGEYPNKAQGSVNPIARKLHNHFDVIFLIGSAILLCLMLSLMTYDSYIYIVASLLGGVLILVQAYRIRKILLKGELPYLNEIAAVTQSIVDGKMNAVVPEKSEYSMQPLARNINRMREGYGTALQDRLKSEQMKTELIANVSHDLKTPLTSIINYVDLLKQVELEPEYARDYVAILDQKSARLHTMIQDLFQVSRAASGDIELSMERLDIAQLLKQTLAELSEAIEASGLHFIVNIPEEPEFYAQADGEKLHRVFENFITNILKYALVGTRVYIDMARGEEIGITMRNISNYEMNFSEEEIIQRFNRSDKARTSEGSGLGLAICKSFLDLMHMGMRITTDGDLFKVEILISPDENPQT